MNRKRQMLAWATKRTAMIIVDAAFRSCLDVPMQSVPRNKAAHWARRINIQAFGDIGFIYWVSSLLFAIPSRTSLNK